MREMEAKIQQQWADECTFEEDYPAAEAATDVNYEKFFCNFPYPYMNGRLHLGHAFTITKADFAAGYQRLKGKTVLFPFAFHCTGMPIQAAAYKLKREIEDYGLENLLAGNFDVLDSAAQEMAALDLQEDPDEGETDPGANKAKGNKTKLMAKTGNQKGKRAKTQWEILQMCNVPNEEIPHFCDPQYSLHYFPPLALDDLKLFGVHVDWRRSFITTDTNPYYDSFIQWQFRRLKQANKIAFGKRPTVYSRRDGQACMDHDRASGEGKGPQEYTLIKMRLHSDGVETLVGRVASLASSVKESPIYLVAATLRAETMYGQTNCFVLPDGTYGAYRMKNGDVFICSEHSAVNMAHQAEEDMVAIWGQPDKLSDVVGRDLLGLPLKAPNAPYERIYTLPLLTISMTKGTGLVTSVPSDAPDDYAALRDMQTQPALREEYGIALDMVADYQPIPIIRIPGGDPDLGVHDWGDMAAVTACKLLQVRDQHDKTKLAKIKKSVYNKGFYAGVMTVGSQKGKKVEEAKDLVKKELIEAGWAVRYWEPEEEIVSRSGDVCVIAFIDQWYLKYGDDLWRDRVREHICDKTGMEENPEDEAKTKDADDAMVMEENTFDAFGVRKEYLNTVDWLGNWACSRSFGLGTRVPWDKQFVVESLSDSTIYMAYYTVAHFLQGKGNMNGTKPGPLGVKAADLNDSVWDYIFSKGPYPEGCAISEENLKKMKAEFEFWYPFDLRVSGKDLIRNHLIMSLFNHAAIWPDRPEMWPRAFFTNGHVMVDNQKMSKSSGNFISLVDAVRGNNVHLYVPIEKRKLTKVVLKADAVGEATCTTKQPHGLKVGTSVSISKSKNNNGFKTITYVTDNTFSFSSAGEDNSNSAVVEVTEKNWRAHEWRSQSWTADTVRYALAAAGDTLSDANFESDVANGAIILLQNELDWADKMTSPETDLREGDDLTLQDKLFLIRMDECIREADAMYEAMKISMAMKSAFNDMRITRKGYRDYHEKCDLRMHRGVVRKFLEALVIMASPVMTHWSEHIWRNILKNEGTVTRASWPSESGLPKELLVQDKYLQDAVTNFRKKLMSKKKAKGAAKNVKPKTRSIIYVQTTFPSWKKKALEWLDSKWDEETNSIKDPKAIKAEANEFQKSNEGLKGEKMFMGVISFAMGQTKTIGRAALSTEMPFDEMQLLEESKAYISASLELKDGVQVVSANDDSVEDPEGQRDQAEPGNPAFCAL
jgi:leucyl-tRNA synthetase family protein